MTKLELRNNIIVDPDKIKQLSKEFNLDAVFTSILCHRGLDNKEKINAFLYGGLESLSDPFLFTGMKCAVQRIQKALENQEKILIYGDYDCDGVGAIAILYLALASQGNTPDYYIPTRSEEGYGLNIAAIDKIRNEYAPDLIITVDLGTTSVDEINYIKSLGIDVIVTDHHALCQTMPDCVVVNPCLDPHLTSLCGAGVAFMLVYATFGAEVAFQYLDICAISTIADIVPLVGDNRIIAKHGIENIRKGNCRKGIKELINIREINIKQLDSYDIGYRIAPMLNASGRLNSAYSSLSLLIEDDLTAISMLAEELNLNNKERQELNVQIYNEAKAQLSDYDLYNNKLIVLQHDNWNEGVIGIVASKVVEEFHKPTILLTLNEEGVYTGSARSIAGINIHQMLTHCEKHLIRYGGHAMAAGLTLQKKEINKFLHCANAYIASNYTDSDTQKRIKYDTALSIRKASSKLFDNLSLLEPYGHSNPRPIFLDSTLSAKFRRIGKSNHIKMYTRQGELIYFNGYPQADYYNEHTHNIIYTAEYNYYNGQSRKQFKVKDILPSGALPSPDTLFNRYLRTFVKSYYRTDDTVCKKTGYKPLKGDKPLNKGYKPLHKGDKPTLYIAFCATSFAQCKAKYSDINHYILTSQEINGKDSLVLSPDRSFPFEYYRKIVVLNSISDTYLNFLQTKSSNVVVEVLGDFDTRITIESLREDYIFMYNNIGNAYKFKGLEELYQYLVGFGYLKSYNEFMAAFYTFIDVELIKIANSDILSVDNNKVDLLQSPVFKYLSRE